MVTNPVVAVSTGAIGLGPYGDETEHTGKPVVIVATPPHRPFFDTDARSVMITLLPHHYNMIPNPAFRAPSTGTNSTGWLSTGIEPSPTSFSWRVANSSADAALRAITAGTSNASVDPNPLGSPAYIDGQVVKVVDNLTANATVAWLKIDNAATMTVSQAAAIGITLATPLPKYRVLNPTLDSLDAADSWVGKSVVCYGDGSLRYREGPNKFVYCGALRGAQDNQWDYRRGGPEYTFSVYVKGEGEVRLTMNSYLAMDRLDQNSGPEYQNLLSVATPSTYPAGQSAIIETGTGRVWTAITYPAVPTVAPFYEDIGRGPALASVSGEWTQVDADDEWHRVVLKTRARVEENEGRISFNEASWIDTLIEIRSANGLKISSVMLDPTEYPDCAYFDGGMTENLALDDFIWEGSADASVSYYYLDRVIRTKWLYDKMGSVVPAGRPYQIFFGSYWRPYVGSTGKTIIMVPPA